MNRSPPCKQEASTYDSKPSLSLLVPLPVEVKATPRPSSRDLAGLNAFLDTYEAASFGVVVCPCPAPKVLSSRVIALLNRIDERIAPIAHQI